MATAQRHNRDENLRCIRKFGRKAWKRESHDHRRSVAESTMYRFKRIFGNRLSTRIFAHQAVELFIKCVALNRMIQIAQPDNYALQS